MFGSLGMPEFVVMLVIGLFWGVPIATAVWGVVTLHRIRLEQQAMGIRLASIERLLQGGR